MELESFIWRGFIQWSLLLAYLHFCLGTRTIVAGPSVRIENRTVQTIIICKECPPGFEPFPSCQKLKNQTTPRDLFKIIYLTYHLTHHYHRVIISECKKLATPNSTAVRRKKPNGNHSKFVKNSLPSSTPNSSLTNATTKQGSSILSIGIITWVISGALFIVLQALILALCYSKQKHWYTIKRTLSNKETCTEESSTYSCKSAKTENTSMEAEDYFVSPSNVLHKCNMLGNNFDDAFHIIQVPEPLCYDDENYAEKKFLENLDYLNKNSDQCHMDDSYESESVSGLCERMEWSTDSDTVGFSGIILETRKDFTSEGGIMQVDGSSVSIKVPKGAIAVGQMQEIYAKVYLGRPNDWQQLQSAGHVTGLPHVELGPSGAKFLKPVEVSVESSGCQGEEDIDFEFAEGNYSKESVWKKAIRASTKKEAKKLAQLQEPHVSFFLNQKVAYAYYMHFTLARLLFKKCEGMYLKATVCCSKNSKIQNGLMLVVLLYQSTEEGRTILARTMSDMNLEEVAVIHKPIKVLNNGEPASVAISNMKGTWQLEQGQEKQDVSLRAVFDPQYLDKLTTVDYILTGIQDNCTDFSCSFHVSQKGNGGAIDLKVKVSVNWINKRESLLSVSSGYDSCAEDTEVHVIKDDGFPIEDEGYLQALFNELSQYIGSRYGQFARNLKVCQHDIERICIDRQSYGCRDICFHILRDWLNKNTFENDFKCDVIFKIECALEATDLPCKIILPESTATTARSKRIPRETVV